MTAYKHAQVAKIKVGKLKQCTLLFIYLSQHLSVWYVYHPSFISIFLILCFCSISAAFSRVVLWLRSAAKGAFIKCCCFFYFLTILANHLSEHLAYPTNLYSVYRDGKTIAIAERSEDSFSIPRVTLPWQPISWTKSTSSPRIRLELWQGLSIRRKVQPHKFRESNC